MARSTRSCRIVERLGRRDDVLLMTFSEFGRRVQQNASNGTDHGTAEPLFMVGGAVQGGLHGAYPSLSDLDRGDLKYTTDFRSVYSSVLRGWLGTAPEPILGGAYPRCRWWRSPADTTARRNLLVSSRPRVGGGRRISAMTRDLSLKAE